MRAAFQKFKAVKDACIEKVLAFKWAFEGTNIAPTPKIHIKLEHIVDFFYVKGEKKGLGYYSEQVFESVHHDFKVFEENSSVHFEHKRFKEMQLKTLIRYNSLHM